MNNNQFKLSFFVTLLMAFAIGVSVACNYYAQPLLHSITDELDISVQHAGIIVTTAQFGYAAGLLLLAPLGDKFERKTLIVLFMIFAMMGLILCAISTSSLILIMGTAIAGFFSAVSQTLILPLAVILSKPSQRGKTIGMLMAGLLLGILCARMLAGVISNLFDWRMVYWIAAAAMALVIVLLMAFLPKYTEKNSLNYWRLLFSIVQLYPQQRVLRIRSFLGGCAFALISMIWATLAFLLSDEPYYYSNFIIGLFGLTGVVGAMSPLIIGRLLDKGKAILVTFISLSLLLVAWLPLFFAQISVAVLIFGIIMLDFSVQVTHVCCMNAIYQIPSDAKARMNSGYMTCYFIGGMLGSVLGPYLFSHYGWLSIVFIGSMMTLASLLVWIYYLKTQPNELANLIQK